MKKKLLLVNKKVAIVQKLCTLINIRCQKKEKVFKNNQLFKDYLLE